MTITFVGGGNMASALMGGMIARGRRAGDFAVIEPSAAQREAVAARFAGAHVHAEAVRDAFATAPLVVLAVKPQQMHAACAALAPFVHGIPVVLSIAAGTRSADISRWLGGYARIVRAMPNTPALVGAGISGVHAGPAVDDAGRAAVATVLEAIGDVLWVESEAMLDAVTGVSGSGPAYVFYFLEALERAALELGFAEADARRLAYATFSGAVRLAQASSVAPATLRAQVTSKGGTTERGIATLDAGAVAQTIVDAAKAATARARELGDEGK